MCSFVLFAHFWWIFRNSTSNTLNWIFILLCCYSHSFTIHRHFASEQKYEYHARAREIMIKFLIPVVVFFFLYFSFLRRVLTSIEVTIAFGASTLNVVAKNSKHFILGIYLFIVQFQLLCTYVYHCRMLWRCVNMNKWTRFWLCLLACSLGFRWRTHLLFPWIHSIHFFFFFQKMLNFSVFDVGVRWERSNSK